MGIEDYDDLSKEEQDYYYEDWKQELFQNSFEAFKEKNMKHLDDFIEYIQQAKEYQDEMNEYAEGGSVNKGYNVFNYTDDIYATDEVFKTKKLANDFIKEFRSRFSKQGYYRDNQMNKIDVKDIDLLAIPSDFNPFGKAI